MAQTYAREAYAKENIASNRKIDYVIKFFLRKRRKRTISFA